MPSGLRRLSLHGSPLNWKVAKVRKAVVLLGLVLLPALARAEGKADSYLEARLFHFRSSVEGAGTADLSGMEIRWALLDPRGSFRVVLPALSMMGPASVVSLGPAFAPIRKGPGTTGGSGSGPATRTAGAGVMDPIALPAMEEEEVRQYGLGDARLQLRRQVGNDAGWGRFFLDGGVKLPTADETIGLGTGETDLWTGVAWKYEGWVVNLDAYLEWILLGDPSGVTLQDGPGAGFFVEFPGGRGGFGLGVEAARAALEGDPARVQAVVDGRRHGKRVEWGVAATGGLTESAPDFGISLALRY